MSMNDGIIFLQKSPSNPINPQRRKIKKYLFFSNRLHQFHADVSLPSMQLPAEKYVSAPEPSKACRKKS